MRMDFEPHELEEGKCIFCNNSGYRVLHKFRPFQIVRCNRCGLALLTPRLKEEVVLALYDSEEYFSEYSGEGAGYELQEESLFRTFQRLVRILEHKGILRYGSRILEVGCGPGLFLKAVRPWASYSVGIDVSKIAREKAFLYCDATYSSIDEMPSTAFFDLVVGLNLIEHIYDPVSFVKKLANKLAKSGALILGTPLFDGFWYKFLGKNWPLFKPPEHVFFFSHATLSRLLEHSDYFSSVKTFSVLHAFPVSVILQKLGLRIPARMQTFLARIHLWLPGVFLCGIGMRRKRWE